VLPHPARTRTALAVGVSLWFLASLTAGLAGAFDARGSGRPPLALGLAALAPVVAFVAALATSPSVQRFVASLDLRLLTLSQSSRVVGGVFIVLWAAGSLPAGFALPAGLGDLLVGLTAPLVASLVVPRLAARRGVYLAWTAFGMADLVVAVGSGVLHSPTSAGVLAGTVTTAVMGSPPLCLVPTFLVPLAMILHVAALYAALARRPDRRVA